MGKKKTANGSVIDSEDAKAFKAQAEELRKKGDELFAQSQLADSLDAYQRALSFCPGKSEERALLHANRAACFLRERKLHDAKRECDLSLEAQENFGRALVRRARVFELWGRTDEALKDLETAQSTGELGEGGSGALQRLKKASSEVPRGLGIAGLSKGLPSRRAPAGGNRAVVPSAGSPARPERSPATLPRRQVVTTLAVKATLGKSTKNLSVPITASYTDLLTAVQGAFSSSGPLALKYRDSEEELVTIMSKADMRQAVHTCMQRQQAEQNNAGPHGPSLPAPIGTIPPLRLECVEVERSPECPPEERPKGAPPMDEVIEIDEWLLDFADAFKKRLGLKDGETVDMREIGLDKCCEVLENLIASPEAKPLMEAAAAKFQESASAAQFNWGNVHATMARKILDVGQTDILRKSFEQAQSAEPDSKVSVILPSEALDQAALQHFDALEEEYEKIAEHFKAALEIKADNYEAAYNWGQQAFERAKLLAQRHTASPKKTKAADVDKAFAEAAEKFKLAVELVEAQEKQQQAAAKAAVAAAAASAASADAAAADGASTSEPAAKAEDAEPGVYTSRQHLIVLSGNVLFEHSIIKFKRGSADWRPDAEAAVKLYRSVPCSEEDITKVLERHPSEAWAKGGAKGDAAEKAADKPAGGAAAKATEEKGKAPGKAAVSGGESNNKGKGGGKKK